jgi:hypothetical protein
MQEATFSEILLKEKIIIQTLKQVTIQNSTFLVPPEASGFIIQASVFKETKASNKSTLFHNSYLIFLVHYSTQHLNTKNETPKKRSSQNTHLSSYFKESRSSAKNATVFFWWDGREMVFLKRRYKDSKRKNKIN